MIDFHEFADQIPEHTKLALNSYLEFGIVPGSFLQYVICGELFDAARIADRENLRALGSIAMFINRYADSRSYGSRHALNYWTNKEHGQ